MNLEISRQQKMGLSESVITTGINVLNHIRIFWKIGIKEL
jgi:hypothetical protein